jgi:hypothetical protein
VEDSRFSPGRFNGMNRMVAEMNFFFVIGQDVFPFAEEYIYASLL